MSTTTNVLLAIRAAHRPSEPRDEELDQLRDDQVPRSRPPRYPWPIRRIRDGRLHDAQTAQPGENLIVDNQDPDEQFFLEEQDPVAHNRGCTRVEPPPDGAR